MHTTTQRKTNIAAPPPAAGGVVVFLQGDQCLEQRSTTPCLTACDLSRVRLLRGFLAKSRLEGDNDVDGELARLANNASADAAAFGALLFRVLGRATDRSLVFFRRACPSASVDECWLLRLIDAMQSDDRANVEALVAFRVRKDWRGRVRYLVSGLSTRIDA